MSWACFPFSFGSHLATCSTTTILCILKFEQFDIWQQQNCQWAEKVKLNLKKKPSVYWVTQRTERIADVYGINFIIHNNKNWWRSRPFFLCLYFPFFIDCRDIVNWHIISSQLTLKRQKVVKERPFLVFVFLSILLLSLTKRMTSLNLNVNFVEVIFSADWFAVFDSYIEKKQNTLFCYLHDVITFYWILNDVCIGVIKHR